MNTEIIRTLINENEFSDEFIRRSQLKSFLNTSIQRIKSSSLLKSGTEDDNARWLSENLDFLMSINKSVDFKNAKIRFGLITFFKKISLDERFVCDRDDVFILFEELSKNKDFSEIELSSFRTACILSVLDNISVNLKRDPDKIPHLIKFLHGLNRIDFERLAYHFSPLEKILRSDPTGIYSRMSKNAKQLYRSKIMKLAQKKRKPMEEIATEMLKKAVSEGKHIGFYFPKRRNFHEYFPIIAFFAFAFCFLFSFFVKSVFFGFVSFPIFYFFSKNIADRFFAKRISNEILPSLKCETVDEDSKTAVVITALVTGKKDVEETIKKLEKYRLNNKNENDSLYFGLLCDLPQSKKKRKEDDRHVFESIQSEIRRINNRNNCYFAMVRERVYHKSEDAFVGWERKRGAIEQFAKFVKNGEVPKDVFFFGNRDVVGSKFLITLDSDTELGIGQAKRLIGKMIHPLNRPQIIKRPNGRFAVTSGHGIIQPKVAPSLLNPISTPFAKIFSNGSGELPYSGASFDSMQSLFGEGNFCGKGIIDLEAYRKVVMGVFPEQRVLSHDMLEGSLLRCAIASDEHLMDSDPQTAISSDKRLHRWIRGDVQNLRFFPLLNEVRVLFATENLLRYFLPICEFILLIFSSLKSSKSAVVCTLLVLVYELYPVFFDAMGFLVSRNFQLFGRRFRTRMRNNLLNVFYQRLLSFCGIAHKAYFYADAIIRGAYRTFISKKKTLEWQTYSPFTDQKKDPLIFYLPSVLISAVLLLVSKFSFVFLSSILFFIYPLIMLALSEKYIETDLFDSSDKEKLKLIAKEEFKFFNSMVNEKSSFLPPDNVQFEPVEKIANRTSPTNIGLYLASLVSAVDLNILTIPQCVDLIEKAFDSIEKMEHFDGHLFNWYDLSTLNVIGERFISTVDSGNYIASLVVVSNALAEWKKECGICGKTIERVEREIRGANFKSLFDWTENLFFVGIFPEDRKRYGSHYDLYMSESRITSFLSISLGQIPPSHWHTTERPVLSFSGRVGIGSWTGTCFEYFMPTLFMPVIENSLEDESLDFAFYCQKKYVSKNACGTVYGASESAYLLTDENQNLQYKAFGVPYLSVMDRQNEFKVFSPYSSFLMLQKGGKDALKNLAVFDALGSFGPMGYYESIDPDSKRTCDFGVVKSYMAHHKGMSFLALANVLTENKNVFRFMSREGFADKTELLAERFPIEGKIYQRKRLIRSNTSKEVKTKNESFEFKSSAENARLITDGKVTFLAFDNGENRLLYRSKDVVDFENGGIACRIFENGEDLLREAKHCKLRCDGALFENFCIREKKTASIRYTPIYGKNAFFIRIEVNGIPGNCRIEINFQFVLQHLRENRSHPAFHNLSLEGCSNGKLLKLRRRGVENHEELYLYSNRSFKTLFSNFGSETFDWRMLMEPAVTLVFELDSAEHCIVPIVFSFEQNADLLNEEIFDGAFHFSKNLLDHSMKKHARFLDVCQMDKNAVSCLSKILLLLKGSRSFFLLDLESSTKERLWENGISGDRPIISIYVRSLDKNALKKIKAYISAFKMIHLAGVMDFDLVILHENSCGYFDPKREELASLIALLQCDYLIGKHPGIHFVVIKQNEMLFWESISTLFTDNNDEYLLPRAEEKEQSLERCVFESTFVSKEVGEIQRTGFILEKNKFDPPVPFSHIISDSNFGFVCNQNSLGFTWFRNSGLNRISKWENLPANSDGEKLYLEIEGKSYDLLRNAQKVTYHDSFAVYEGDLFGESYSIIATVIAKHATKSIVVLLSKSLSEGELTYSFVPSLGQFPNQNVFIQNINGAFEIRSAISDYKFGHAFFKLSNGNAICFKSGERICFQFSAKTENLIFLGGVAGDIHRDYILSLLESKDEKIVLNSLKEKVINHNESCSALEFWLRYQVNNSRFFGRTGQYQSSGAYGFRDQLQDCLSFLNEKPEVARIHLIRCAAHQFEEGDVLHWWHTVRSDNKRDSGVRTRCSDDYLWLLYGVSEYIDRTFDEDILNVPIPFLHAEPLKKDENERYFSPMFGERKPMLEHLQRAAKLFLSKGLSENCLPDIGSGDWNDGMNQINGDSVWLGFFSAVCLNRCARYFSDELQSNIRSFLSKMHGGLEKSFNGEWFVRSHRNCGQVLGNDRLLESECSIDLITQAFSVFYYLEFYDSEFSIEQDAVRSALLSAFEILVDEKNRIVKLFDKPFQNTKPSPGYIQRYCAGVRENGGQYTHAAVWFAMALLDFGIKIGDEILIEKARIVTELLDPTPNATVERFNVYRREPYVLCGDVYNAKGFRGHGGWSWYTGAASWYLQLLDKWKEYQKSRKQNL